MICRRSTGGRAGKQKQAGFAYVVLLALLALMGVALSVVGPVWSQAQKRSREEELLRVGMAYVRAIDSYYNAPDVGLKQFPPSVEALLLDTRNGTFARHLRKAYGDPVNEGKPFRVISAADGTMRGVASRSDATPLRQLDVIADGVRLAAATRYMDWQFVQREP